MDGQLWTTVSRWVPTDSTLKPSYGVAFLIAATLGTIAINFNFPAYVREVSVEDVSEHATRAIFRSEGKAKFRQISIPDRTGKFPWESGFSGDPKMYLCRKS